jgi:antitoxin component YwqK of YwqJK toxin-antitoxin module
MKRQLHFLKLWMGLFVATSAPLCLGAEIALVQDPADVALDQVAVVRVEGVPPSGDVTWRVSPKLRIENTDQFRKQLAFRMLGEGKTEVSVKVGAITLTAPARGPQAEPSITGDASVLRTTFDSKGRMKAQGRVKQGRCHGPWLFWDEGGRVNREIIYAEGRPARQTVTTWSDAGRKQQAERLDWDAQGKQVGKYITQWGYYDDGKLLGEKTHSHSYDDKGRIRIRRHGTWFANDESGQRAQEMEYREGWLVLPEAKTPEARIYANLEQSGRSSEQLKSAIKAAANLKPDQQAALARLCFLALADMDDGELESIEQLYRLVIGGCPSAQDRVHESYWRLTNLLTTGYDPARNEEVVQLLEPFVAKTKASNVLMMNKYGDGELKFSPIRALHHAYEALGRYDKIAAYYDKREAAGARFIAQEQFDYASALDKTKRPNEALRWYRSFLKLNKEPDSFLVEVAEKRVKELTPPKQDSAAKPKGKTKK